VSGAPELDQALHASAAVGRQIQNCAASGIAAALPTAAMNSAASFDHLALAAGLSFELGFLTLNGRSKQDLSPDGWLARRVWIVVT